MNAWVLKVCGSIAMASAVAVGMTGVPAEPRHGNGALSDAGEQARNSGGGHGESGRARVQVRSRESRETEVSVASRFRSRGKVTVTGAVGLPGPTSMTAGLTIGRAVEKAGPLETSFLKSVKLIRNGEVQSYDLTKQENKEVELQPGDLVTVNERIF